MFRTFFSIWKNLWMGGVTWNGSYNRAREVHPVEHSEMDPATDAISPGDHRGKGVAAGGLEEELGQVGQNEGAGAVNQSLIGTERQLVERRVGPK